MKTEFTERQIEILDEMYCVIVTVHNHLGGGYNPRIEEFLEIIQKIKGEPYIDGDRTELSEI